MALRVVLIGATGVFGSRIARRLTGDPRFVLILAGRQRSALEALRDELGDSAAQVATLDVTGVELSTALARLAPQLVIHTAGPFQSQDYRVAEACLACGSDYIDLADGRDFVSGIGRLDERAREAGRLLVSGASSVPALSSAVVDALLPRFGALQSIEHAINPGNRTPRGDATVASILGYCGRPIRVWRDGRWQHVYGWMSGKRQLFPFGRRHVGVCEVPDLELFPIRYPQVRTVLFRAGLELPLLQWGTWCAAWLVRLGLVRNLAAYAPRLRRFGERFIRFGSDVGGMVMELAGHDMNGAPLQLRWWLDAAAGDGPQVPVTPAVLLAQRLADGLVTAKGAQPCTGLLTLDQLVDGFAGYALRTGLEMLD
ncbi:saccharopine dehydrogenase NADP-binding domain-containing protein [Rhodanobacter sp. C05]|uniref:saccharopine dehydrogenase family protein n=1 Tax=Rhodanobacter sp. C05 TaxID=1945855 RepID=UPI000985B653|nr:saccharopine dehydrogenase NADP-binding domain-containing protein [Rhodanobacter sp. C05]OOG43377.1 saccharopine dehydrogenase [Rhodanobacter sp. C05]